MGIVTVNVYFLTSSTTTKSLEPYLEFGEEFDLWWNILYDIAFGKHYCLGPQIFSWRHLFLIEESEWRYLTLFKGKNYDSLMDEILFSEYIILPVLRYFHIELFSIKKESPRKHFKLSHRCKLCRILWHNIINFGICTSVLW